MKYLLIGAMLTCNQQLLDQFYLAVQMENVGLSIEKLHRMNAHYQYKADYEEPLPMSFEPFHKLCNGQKSTYENVLLKDKKNDRL